MRLVPEYHQGTSAQLCKVFCKAWLCAVTKRLDASEKRVVTKADTPCLFVGKPGFPSTTLITESGLYKLIMRANPNRNPVVKEFQDWVTKVVLPAIRKDGMYVKDEEKVATGEMTEDELVLKVVTMLQGKVTRLQQEKEQLQTEHAVMTPKAASLDAVIERDGGVDFKVAAGMLG